MSTMTKSASTLTALRQILAQAPKSFDYHLYRWSRLDRTALRVLIQEVEEGKHRIHRQNLDQLRRRLYAMEMVEYSNRLSRNARTPEENRYEDEQAPEEPNYLSGRWIERGHYVALEDGRIARRLDAFRALPLCGLRIPVELSEVERAANGHDGISRVRWITGSSQCQRCDGYHVTDSVPVSAPALLRHHDSAIRHCRRCESTAVETHWIGTLRYGFEEVHCSLCGDRHALTTLPQLSEEESAANELSLLRAPMPFNIEEATDSPTNTTRDETLVSVGEDEDLDTVDDMMELGEGGEIDQLFVEGLTQLESDMDRQVTHLDEAHQDTDEPLHDEEPLAPADDQLIMLQNKLWEHRSLKPLRCALLEVVMTQDLPATRVDLMWAAASVLVESCEGMKGTQQKEVAMWLVTATDDDLRNVLPSTDLMTELTMEITPLVLPPVTGKIKHWRSACRIRLARFQYPRAGARILAPKFGVSETVFLKACGH